MSIQRYNKTLKNVLNKKIAFFVLNRGVAARRNSAFNKNQNNSLIVRGIATLSRDGTVGVKKSFDIIRPGQKQVSAWLFLCAGMVFTMVVLGGITRLTRSGLSMVKLELNSHFLMFLKLKFIFS